MMYSLYIKRFIDLIIVFCALVIIGPILLFTTIFLCFANKGAGVFLLRIVRVNIVRFSKLSSSKR